MGPPGVDTLFAVSPCFGHAEGWSWLCSIEAMGGGTSLGRFFFIVIFAYFATARADEHLDAFPGYSQNRDDFRTVGGEVYLPRRPKPEPNRSMRTPATLPRRRENYNGYAMGTTRSSPVVRVGRRKQGATFSYMSIGGGAPEGPPVATNTSASAKKEQTAVQAAAAVAAAATPPLALSAVGLAMHIGSTPAGGSNGGGASAGGQTAGGGGIPVDQPMPLPNQNNGGGNNNGNGGATAGTGTTGAQVPTGPRPFANSAAGLEQALNIVKFQSKEQKLDGGQPYLAALPQGQQPTEANRPQVAALLASQLGRTGSGTRVEGVAIGGQTFLLATMGDGSQRLINPFNLDMRIPTEADRRGMGQTFAFTPQEITTATNMFPELNRRLTANFALFPALNGRGVFNGLNPDQQAQFLNTAARLTQLGVSDSSQLTRDRLAVANYMLQRGYPFTQNDPNQLSNLDETINLSRGNGVRIANMTELSQNIEAARTLRAAGLDPSTMSTADLDTAISTARRNRNLAAADLRARVDTAIRQRQAATSAAPPL